jgi:hypothetical protein
VPCTPLSFLVLLGLVKRSLWVLLLHALQIPSLLHCIVWISPGLWFCSRLEGRGLKGRSEVRWWDKLGRWRPSMDRRRLSSSRGCYRQERKRRWREYAGARCWWLMEGEGRSGGGWGGGSAAGHGGDGGGRR